ncbi:MAG: IclR family transcriptional regulator [Xanthobacteraceae bacterium]|nr:IclR family transcriptional regulator [Xanthobacteraceae bacterium]
MTEEGEDDHETSPAARRGIQSVEIGFRVLAALAAEGEPAPLGAIARRTGLSPSQAHRYLASLIASGMAHQHAASGRYELGPQAIQIGLAALARTDVFAEADPAIAAFTRDSGRTTLLAARGPLGPTIVRWYAGRRPVVTSLTVGSVLPLFNSATGHAFLSFMNDDEIAAARDDEAASAVTRAEIDAIRARVRRTMFATVDELLIPGLRAAAVPILDIQGRAVLVATAMATSAFPRADDEAIVEQLQAVCRALTERFGARWP